MYLVFAANYDIRPCKAQHMWWYLLMLEKFPDALFVVTDDYLYPDTNRWEFNEMKKLNPKWEFKRPTNFIKIEKPVDWPELRDIKNPADIFRKCTKELIWYLHCFLEDIICKNDIEAAFTTCNNQTLYNTCLDHNIPVFHQEQGPLRPPFFKKFDYLDFMGVNGNTDFFHRFERFKEFKDEVKVYSREELLRLVTKPDTFTYVNNLANTRPTHACGVALQVDVDSNMISYNEGWTSADLINKAIRNYGTVLIRNHPSASMHYTTPKSLGGGVIDKSANSLIFVSKCKKIMTINSSVAFEAMIMGREAEILGDSPFKEMAGMSSDEKLLALNFAIFSYFVPHKLYGNREYYEFRKLERNEKILYNKGRELF